MKKRLFILANSYKHYPMRCIAGREVVQNDNGHVSCGSWIRPVTKHDEGALRLDECIYANGEIPQPLDVVDIPLDSPENFILQSENYYIDPGLQWNKIGRWDAHTAARLDEHPPDLWLENGQKSDRASPDFLRQRKPYQSLYLIKPENFHLKIETKIWQDQPKKRLRGIIEYGKRMYDMSITDPFIEHKYCPDFRNANDGIISLKHDDQNLLCVSLTPEFQGLHYKVVATVLELMP